MHETTHKMCIRDRNKGCLAFSRDGYTFVFYSYHLPEGVWSDIRIEGDYLSLIHILNGHLLGYNQGSKTPAEWDITPYVKEGENTVALEVYQIGRAHV